jgi:hypothetical protein
MFLLDNKPLPIDTAFTHDGIQYPSNWLRFASAEDKAAIGITEVAEPTRADDRFYWNGDINNPKALEDRLEVKEDGAPLMVQTLDNADPENPVMVDTTEQVVTKGLKSTFTQQIKHTAGSLLAATDWMIIRKVERDIEVPSSIVQERQHIVAEANRLEDAISKVTNVEALINVLNNQQWSN